MMAGDDIRPLRGRFNELLSSSRRWKANWPAHLVWAGYEVPCVIADISGRGAKVRIEAFPEQGTAVYLIVDNMRPIAAEVAWRCRGEGGLRFDELQQWVLTLQEASAAPVEVRSAAG
jgi:hypothetical protein